MSRISNLKKKRKIILITSIIIAIVTVVAVTIATFAIKNKNAIETSEVQEIEEIEVTKVADVLDSNIQFDYNTEPTEETIELKIKEYDESYNLYYCIKEVGQEENTENSEDIEDKEYILYNGEPISIEVNSVLSFKYEKDGIYSEKAYKLQITNIINKGEIKEGATKEELEKGKVEEKEKVNSTQPYYIRINYTANCVTIYKKDDSGNYTIPVKAMVCSTGTATPRKGTYKTLNKYVWKQLNGGVWGQYSTRIVGHILFHSVPYASANHNALKYVAYDKLGTNASAGCIRLTTADAKWIYDNCGLGTMVEFYSDSNPGPLGKPSARKISSVVECRDWDPTDPAPGNPWRTWKGENTQTQQTKPNTTNSTNKTNNTNVQNTSTNNTNTNTENTNITNTNNTTNTSTTNTNTNTNTNTSGNENTTNNTNNTNVVNQTGE